MAFIFDKDNQPFKTAGEANYKKRQDGIEGKVLKHGEGGYVIDTEAVVATDENNDTTQEVVQKPKHRVTTPWKPASRIEIPEHLKIPGFRYRSCNTSQTGNIEKKKAEGWIVDKELSKKMEHIATIDDSKKLDGTTRFRELIVMRMPEEMAKSRDEYYAKRTVDPKKQAKDELKKLGIQTYEPKDALVEA